MRTFIEKGKEWLSVLVILATATTIFYLTMKNLVEPLGPAITLLFVFTATRIAMSSKKTHLNWILFGGLALYLASWKIAGAGPMWGMMTCYAGIALWITGVYQAFSWTAGTPEKSR